MDDQQGKKMNDDHKREHSMNDDESKSNKKQRTCFTNEYQGWKVPSDRYSIPIITEDLDAEQFYHNYIKQRRPVVLRYDKLPKEFCRLEEWKKNNLHLQKLAGQESVVVEQRLNKNDSFGKGRKELNMKFGDFLRNFVEKGDDSHYLTTQDVQADPETGRPDLIAPFMKALKNDFPYRPQLMGHLIPSNINLWMGSSNGASSGLHHDYHDNLYIVLRGEKRFRLYSPHDAESMYTRGTLERIHPNGRINHVGETTTAYGADVKAHMAAQAAQAQAEAENNLMKAEQAVADGLPGAEEALEKAEARLEETMEAMLDAEFSDEDESSEGDDDEHELKEDNDDVLEKFEGEQRIVDKTVSDPNNFSRIEPHLLPSLDDDNNKTKEKLRAEYPKFLQAKSAICHIKEGDMLYLPASWFHEVTSFRSKDGHLALNYWFHPPDAIDCFNDPYSTKFWEQDYEQRMENSKEYTDVN